MAFQLPDAATPFGERVARRLRDEKVMWFTTMSDRGTPQPTPIWFLWDEASSSFLIYSRADAKRLEHLRLESEKRQGLHPELLDQLPTQKQLDYLAQRKVKAPRTGEEATAQGMTQAHYYHVERWIAQHGAACRPGIGRVDYDHVKRTVTVKYVPPFQGKKKGGAQ